MGYLDILVSQNNNKIKTIQNKSNKGNTQQSGTALNIHTQLNTLTSTLSVTFRSLHLAPKSCSNLRLVYSNWYAGTNGEADNTNDITIRSSIEYPIDTYHPVFFSSKRNATIEPGASIESSPVGVDIPAGASFWVRTWVSVASSGMTYPAGRSTVNTAFEGNNINGLTNPTLAPTLVASSGGTLAAGTYLVAYSYASGDDYTKETLISPTGSITVTLNQKITATLPTLPPGTTVANYYLSDVGGNASTLKLNFSSKTTNIITSAIAGRITPIANTTAGIDLTTPTTATGVPYVYDYGYLPLLILGNSYENKSSVLIIGDSIPSGLGDTPSRDYGFIVRALNNNFPYTNMSKPSERAQQFQGGLRRRRMQLLGLGSGFSHVICNYGTNDITSFRTFAQIQVDLLDIWTAISKRGIKVYQCTILPRTTSTDAWATTGNQTPLSNFGVTGTRQQLNDWFKTIPSPLSGIFDTASVVENAGVWKVSPTLTADGTHPNSVGHSLMAATINTALFT